jgi:hypothetical protein
MKRKGLLIIILFAFLISSSQEKKKENRILPDHIKLQFAGGIGFFSLGIGYDNRNTKLEGDFIYGYVPKKIGGITIHTISSKITWFPLKKIEIKSLAVKPLAFGLLVNYTFGKQYFLFSPENYPYNYYDHPTALHFGGFMGGQISKALYDKRLKQLAFYYELITYDVELLSYLGNRKSLNLKDIFNVALGIKFSL